MHSIRLGNVVYPSGGYFDLSLEYLQNTASKPRGDEYFIETRLHL